MNQTGRVRVHPRIRCLVRTRPIELAQRCPVQYRVIHGSAGVGQQCGIGLHDPVQVHSHIACCRAVGDSTEQLRDQFPTGLLTDLGPAIRRRHRRWLTGGHEEE